MAKSLPPWWKSDLGGEQVPPAYVELVDQLVQGLKYLCDTSLDAAPLRFLLAVVLTQTCAVAQVLV